MCVYITFATDYFAKLTHVLLTVPEILEFY